MEGPGSPQPQIRRVTGVPERCPFSAITSVDARAPRTQGRESRGRFCARSALPAGLRHRCPGPAGSVRRSPAGSGRDGAGPGISVPRPAGWLWEGATAPCAHSGPGALSGPRPSILPSVPASLPASVPPSPLHLPSTPQPEGPTGPSSHALNSGPRSGHCRKGEPEFSWMPLPPRSSLQRCSVPPPPPAPTARHVELSLPERGDLEDRRFFFGGGRRAGGCLGQCWCSG